MIDMKLPPFLRLLGDPHLGRKFTAGVPPYRRGEREHSVERSFKLSLSALKGVRLHVCVGDLFDKFRVPEEIILMAAQAYRDAAEIYPDCTFVVLRGNHDASRDTDHKSSFDVFEALMSGIPNVKVVSEKPVSLEVEKEWFVFYPWHPFKNAAAIAKEAERPVGFWAVGHWDIESFGEDNASTDNMVPYEDLQEAIGIITGHYHRAKTFLHGNIPVMVTGSMQPYSHAEDLEGKWYVTHKLTEVEANLADNPAYYKDLNLRVLLQNGERPLADIDCLSLMFKSLGSQGADELDVDVDTFDLQSIFFSTMTEFAVSEPYAQELWGNLSEVAE